MQKYVRIQKYQINDYIWVRMYITIYWIFKKSILKIYLKWQEDSWNDKITFGLFINKYRRQFVFY